MPAELRLLRLLFPWVALAALLCGCNPATVTPNPFTPADRHVAAGEYTAAETAYLALAQSMPGDPRPALRLADLYRRWRRPQEGLAALDEAVQRGTAPDAVAAVRLELLAQTGDWAAVATQSEARLASTPGDPTALKLLAQAQAQQHQCEAAARTAARWRAADRHNAEAVRLESILTGDPFSLCETDAELCGAVQSCGAQCELRLGVALVRRGEWSLAACVLADSVAATPDSAEAQTWLGEALARIGRDQEARRHLLAATTLAPESALAWLLLGAHDLRLQNIEEAKDALARAHTLDPENPAPCLALAEVESALSDYDEVTTWIEAAVNAAPLDAEVWKAVARFYLERHLSDTEYPIRAILSAIKLAPDDGEAWMLLGWFRLMERNITESVVALDEAVRLSPHLGEAHYLRGQALQMAGQGDAAREAYTRASDLGYRP